MAPGRRGCSPKRHCLHGAACHGGAALTGVALSQRRRLLSARRLPPRRSPARPSLVWFPGAAVDLPGGAPTRRVISHRRGRTALMHRRTAASTGAVTWCGRGRGCKRPFPGGSGLPGAVATSRSDEQFSRRTSGDLRLHPWREEHERITCGTHMSSSARMSLGSLF